MCLRVGGNKGTTLAELGDGAAGTNCGGGGRITIKGFTLELDGVVSILPGDGTMMDGLTGCGGTTVGVTLIIGGTTGFGDGAAGTNCGGVGFGDAEKIEW